MPRGVRQAGRRGDRGAVGKPFDPELHNAVMQQPAPRTRRRHRHAGAAERVHLQRDKVIRHATWSVAE
ncbi:MAG: hypothetical protein V8T36_09860 [Ruthenibacterium lactatiformans]